MPEAQRSDQGRAMRSMTTHSFHRGLGYVDHGCAPAFAAVGPVSDANCDPPAKTKDGSRHVLRSPDGSTIVFSWVEAEKAWARNGGNRLAWTAQHLSRAGWKYVKRA